VCQPLLPRGDLANAGIGSVQTFRGPMEMFADDPEYLIPTVPDRGIVTEFSARTVPRDYLMFSAAMQILATTALGGAAGLLGGLFGVGGGAIGIFG
jgi:hypothetical protein